MPAQVLIVDDDAPSRDIFGMVLTRIGYERVDASTGSEAMRHLENTTPDLIILDLHLPQVPGARILSYLYSEPRFDDTRVIVSTAHAAASSVITLRPGDHFLLKPISVAKLRAIAQDQAVLT